MNLTNKNAFPVPNTKGTKPLKEHKKMIIRVVP